ncbi:Stk1 family PASTA domain-containing Ser/Thr kinase [Lactococcus termiticola]|uniref:non-specific serine/threonine protein kinase n=1 Tax=Lactococcus termiticola TaxID=2169526 RepID=A0A2R5HK01_9LACT|nr:Stk1 family PASTA domain-containing Ser/Thr kinase [Lactococcus termiticola]GBG97038.1 serine/threonine protein kinase [Lactococcus termiticola]
MIQMGQLFADRYQVKKEVGRGGMANVYQGEDSFIDNRKVAIKVLRPNFENDSIAIARFQREAFSMAELSHPNIVSITDVGESDNQQYIVMEYVDGPTLKQYIKEHAPLSNEEAINIATEILSAMQMAHGHGIIHRDLKPQNILMTANGTAKVTDFGIAKALSDTSLTQTNTMFGSVHYLSPEQARGANATMQSDIYAIGVILYELLTGEIPFDGDSAVAIALKHFQENIPSIIAKNKNVPQALENVVIKATAKKPEDRYENVAAMMADLATSTSLDRANEPKLVFKQDKDATKPMPKNLIDTSDTNQLIKPKQEEAKAEKPEENKADETAKKKGKKGLIIGIIATLLLIAGVAGAWIGLTPNNVNVPNVQNLSLSEAESKIKAAGLQVGTVTEETNSQIAEGNVVRTNPSAGSSTRKGSRVTIYKSAGNNIKLDNYVGRQYQDVVNDLLNKGILTSQINKVLVQSNKDAGEVTKQDPGSGSFFDPSGDGQITLTVSQGKMVNIPNYLSDGGLGTMQLDTLKQLLVKAGIPNSNIVTQETTNTQGASANNIVYRITTADSSSILQNGAEVDPTNQFIIYYLGTYQAPQQTSESTTAESSPQSSPATGNGGHSAQADQQNSQSTTAQSSSSK